MFCAIAGPRVEVDLDVGALRLSRSVECDVACAGKEVTFEGVEVETEAVTSVVVLARDGRGRTSMAYTSFEQVCRQA